MKALLKTLLFACALFTIITANSQDWEEIQNVNTDPISSNVMDEFGGSVAMNYNGSYAIVGAPNDSENGYEAGAAYLYKRSGTDWALITKFVSDDIASGDHFGSSVAMYTNYIVIGASGENSNTGAVYVFNKDTNTDEITQIKKVVHTTIASSDYFGSTIDYDNQYFIVGAPFAGSYGRAYVYHLSSGVCTLKKVFYGPSDASRFGDRVRIEYTSSGNYIAGIGDYNYKDPGDYTNSRGRVHIYEGTNTSWTENTVLVGQVQGGRFGYDFDLTDNRLAIGVPYDDNGANNAGLIYIYQRGESNWTYSYTMVGDQSNGNLGNTLSFSQRNSSIYRLAAYERGQDGQGEIRIYSSASGTSFGSYRTILDSNPEDYGFFGKSSICIKETYILGARDNADINGTNSGVVYFATETAEYNDWGSIVQKLPTPYTSPFRYESEFGSSIDIDGNTAVIGAPNDYYGSGFAEVYQKTNLGWNKIATLTESSNIYDNNFGSSVSIDGNWIAVGASGGKDTDRVYMFKKPASGWTDMTETAVISATDIVAGDNFGRSVYLKGNTLVVGSYRNRNNSLYTGAAYVYTKSEGADWTSTTQTAKLTASDGASNDYFGWSVATDEGVIVVGSPEKDVTGTRDGGVYLFEKPETGWINATETYTLSASDQTSNDYFGYAVDFDNDVIAVGARGNNTVYVFEKPLTGWASLTESARLNASSGGSYLGYSVDIDDDRILAGAIHDTYTFSKAGSAFLFEKSGSSWTSMTESVKFNSSNPGLNYYFGNEVALDGVLIGIGSYNQESAAGAVYFHEQFIPPTDVELVVNPIDENTEIGEIAGYYSGFDDNMSETLTYAFSGEGSSILSPTNALNISESSHVEIPHDNAFNLVENDFTIEGQIKIESDVGSKTIASKGNGSDGNSVFIFQVSEGKLSIYLGSGATAGWTTSSNSLPLNTWTHVAVSYQASTKTISFYVDGVKETLAPLSLTPSSNSDTNSLFIGQQGFTIDFLISTFIFNPDPLVLDWELTTANIQILDGADVIYDGALNASTNQIKVKSIETDYTVKIIKDGFTTYSATFTQTELEAFFLTPLIVTLQ
ncbi:FG-GAP repeat-containing protein [Ekhidna lutea]|uniref:FG-GAP repeat-containing protein n=1 Tax=Ekhidna lutea TaxID=447679 RepID=A0A239JYE6_EKHLU|nr:LamG-like jellyroll fold domain-containing protein [Ekhidna lutea]SNT11027.1 FG-GAP repeat-containing protein [Ekhidna lutea]